MRVFAMQTSDIEGIQAAIFPHVYPADLRAAATIYIVTGGAVLYSPFTSPGRISGEISRANMYNGGCGSSCVRNCGQSVLARAFVRNAEPPESLDEKFTRIRDRPVLQERPPVRYRYLFGLA